MGRGWHDRLSRRRRLSRITAMAAMGLSVAACGSTAASPAGLQGTQAGLSTSPIAREDRQAAVTLKPAAGTYLAGKTAVRVLGSTTPADGDINPYAIWPVTVDTGSVRAGDVLVDDFNNRSNDQGTGTTIVDVHPSGRPTVFAHLPRHVAGCPGGVGLTTAMVQLRTGWVIVGSLPTSNGRTDTAGSGCLLVLSSTGKLAGTITGHGLAGPWDETVRDDGATATLFVTDTLVGDVAHAGTTTVNRGDVVRLSLVETAKSPPRVTAETQVASGLGERADASALVRGPTGVALGSDGTLYVADTVANRIAAIPDAMTRTGSAGTGRTVAEGGQLDGPLGLATAPGGDLLAANAYDGKIVEVTPSGHEVGERYVDDNVGQDPAGNGDLFDVAIRRGGDGVLFVNDGTNTLETLSS